MRNALESALEKASRALSKQHGITLIAKGNEAYTNGKQIVIPSLNEPISDTELLLSRAFEVHETSHCLYTDWKVVKTVAAKGEMAKNALNAIEDCFINRHVVEDFGFAGIRDTLEDAYKHLHRRNRHLIPRISLFNRALLAIMAKDRGLDATIYGEDAAKLTEAVAGITAEIPKIKSTAQSASIAARILETWQSLANEPEPEPDEQKPDGESESDEDGEERPEESGAEDADTSQQAEERRKLRELAKELMASEPTDFGTSLGSALEDAVRRSGKGEKIRPYRKWSTEHDRHEIAAESYPEAYAEIVAAVREHIGTLKSQLMIALQTRSRTETRFADSGTRISRRRIHQICVPVGTPEVFERTRKTLDLKSIAVGISLDESGSLLPHRDLTIGSAVMLLEALDTLGVPCECSSFTTLDGFDVRREIEKEAGKPLSALFSEFASVFPLAIKTFKRFNEPLRVCKARFGDYQPSGYTPMADGILAQAKALLDRPERMKVVFVATDGAEHHGDSRWDETVLQRLKTTVERVEAAGVHVVCIGMASDFPVTSGVFRDALTVTRLEEFPRQLCAKALKTLLRSAA